MTARERHCLKDDHWGTPLLGSLIPFDKDRTSRLVHRRTMNRYSRDVTQSTELQAPVIRLPNSGVPIAAILPIGKHKEFI